MESASVGVILDSSVIIAAERRDHTVREILEQVKANRGETEIGISVVTIAELVHGAYRTKTQAQDGKNKKPLLGERMTVYGAAIIVYFLSC